MTKLLRSLVQDTSGATAVEYGLMVALIALAIIGTVSVLGVNLVSLFTNLALGQALGGS
jgi:pilus assembly protein Flp/PilA